MTTYTTLTSFRLFMDYQRRKSNSCYVPLNLHAEEDPSIQLPVNFGTQPGISAPGNHHLSRH